MRSRKIFPACIGVVCMLLSASCHGLDQTDSKERFLKQPLDERRALILSYPPEKQVELYLAAMQKHPPDLALANALARNGSEIIPSLKQRLAHEDSDIAKLHLIDVFVRMQRHDHYAVARDRQTMQFLSEQVASMQDAQWKQIAGEMLEEIRSSTEF